MRGEKNVIYENSLGQRISFDNKKLFIESIDMTGTTGIHASESLASADGQTSVYERCGPYLHDNGKRGIQDRAR